MWVPLLSQGLDLSVVAYLQHEYFAGLTSESEVEGIQGCVGILAGDGGVSIEGVVDDEGVLGDAECGAGDVLHGRDVNGVPGDAYGSIGHLTERVGDELGSGPDLINHVEDTMELPRHHLELPVKVPDEPVCAQEGRLGGEAGDDLVDGQVEQDGVVLERVDSVLVGTEARVPSAMGGEKGCRAGVDAGEVEGLEGVLGVLAEAGFVVDEAGDGDLHVGQVGCLSGWGRR